MRSLKGVNGAAPAPLLLLLSNCACQCQKQNSTESASLQNPEGQWKFAPLLVCQPGELSHQLYRLFVNGWPSSAVTQC